jgi:hypothetical protein
VAPLLAHHKLPLSITDLQRLNNLKSKEIVQMRPQLLCQMTMMENQEVKSELQALRESSTVVEYVLKKLIRQDWIPLE